MATPPGRPTTSSHGRLFGGDSLYEVLAELAAHRGAKFSVTATDDSTVLPLAATIRRTARQTRKEVRKLQEIGVLEEVARQRKTEVFKITDDAISRNLLSLPELLIARLGAYQRSD
jgi:CelD/BcsL family acetyltransferase involved in cellulose biosynthesis